MHVAVRHYQSWGDFYAIASFIKTQVMMYFVRINTNNINPLIKESLNVNKSLHRFSSRLPIYLYLKNKLITDPS